MSFLCPSPPPPPDYAAAAQAQGAANVDTARVEGSINRPDIYSPNGNQTWSTDPNNPDHYTMNQTLSPDEQSKLNLSNGAEIGGLTALNKYGPGNISKALSTNFSQSGTPASDFDPRYQPDQGIQTDSGMFSAQPLQQDVNLAAAPGIPTADAATRKSVTDSIYNQGASFLDPQFAQQKNQMTSDLSNQGIFSGSDAYNTANDNFARQQQQAYGDLRDRAIQQGGQEMAQDFGLGMQAHQTGVNDITNAGQFHNTAQGQQVGQLEGDMSNRNAALTTASNIASQGSGLYNAGRSQTLNENAQSAMLPINAQNAVLTGSQVNNPNFQPFNNNIQVAPPPIYQAANDQYNAAANTYNAQNAMTGNFLNAGAKIGSAFLTS